MSELPSKWITAPLKECANINMGQSPEGKYVSENKHGLPFYQGKAEFGKTYPTPRKYCIQPTKIAQQNDILLSIRAPVGPTNLCPEESCIGRGLAGIRAHEGLHQQYLLRYFKHIEPWLSQQGTGSTFKAISGGFLSEVEVVIAPLNEQIRIADKLDSMLAKVDAAQARLEKIPTLLKRFRQSVLAAATSGELTREWRENDEFEISEENIVYPKSWDYLTVDDIGEVKGGKRLPKGKKLVSKNTGYPYIKAGQLKNGTVDPAEQEYLEASIQKKIARYIVNKDDAFITIVGACIGDAGLIPKNYDGANLTENAAKICNYKHPLNPKYLSFWLRSEALQKLIQFEIKSGAQGKLALKRIKTLPIPFPNEGEQNEIVRRVESLFTLADTVEKQYLAAKRRLDRLTQSLLAKAFRGELVPQDPKDEPAAELLKRIQAERQQLATEKPKRQSGARSSQNTIATKQTKTNTMQLRDAPENYLFELLAQLGGETHAEVLWKKSELTIDDFYAKLKQEMQANGIVEDKNSPDPVMRKLKVANR